MHAFVHECSRKRNLRIGKKMSALMCLSTTSNINIDYKLFQRLRRFHKQRKWLACKFIAWRSEKGQNTTNTGRKIKKLKSN